MRLVAVYDNHRPNSGPFLRGPLRETNEQDPYWVSVGFQLTPGSETIWARYPAEEVTVVPFIGDKPNTLLLGFTRAGDTSEGVPWSDGTSRRANTSD